MVVVYRVAFLFCLKVLKKNAVIERVHRKYSKEQKGVPMRLSITNRQVLNYKNNLIQPKQAGETTPQASVRPTGSTQLQAPEMERTLFAVNGGENLETIEAGMGLKDDLSEEADLALMRTFVYARTIGPDEEAY